MKKIFIAIIMLESFTSLKAQIIDSVKRNEEVADPGQRPIISRPITDSTIFVAVQQPPTFPGGMEKWMEYVKVNLKYPEKDKAEGYWGKVFVTFVIEKDGSVSNPKVVRGIGGGCDIEAIRLVKNSPKWNPGMQNEKAIRVQWTAMVLFKP
jgi:protein TonB